MPKPSILGNVVPDASGEVFQEPVSVKATNKLWGYMVWVFNDGSARIGLRGSFDVPEGYVDTAAIEIIWTVTATSGDVEWDFDYRAVGGDDTESLDQATAQESVNQNDAAPSAVNERMVTTISLTDGNFAEGDLVQFELFRDLTDAGDTISDDVVLHSARFSYADA